MDIYRITDNIEAGFGTNVNVPADRLIVSSRTKYNNMSEKNMWSKVDPRNSQILPLTTKLQSMETQSNTSGLGTELATIAGADMNCTREFISGVPNGVLLMVV